MLCLILIFSGEIAYLIIASFLLQTQLGITPILNGWLIFFTVAGCFIGSALSSKFSGKLDIKLTILLGLLVAIIGGVIMLITAIFGHMTVILIVGPMVIYMFEAGLIYPNCLAACMSEFPKQAGLASILLILSISAIGVLYFFTKQATLQ